MTSSNPQEKKWVRVTQAENIPLREGRSVEIAGHDIAIFNLGDRFLAVENKCPHRGGPLADGIVSGRTVVCPLHAWKIDLESGQVRNRPEENPCVKTFAITVRDGVVMLEAKTQGIDDRVAALAGLRTGHLRDLLAHRQIWSEGCVVKSLRHGRRTKSASNDIARQEYAAVNRRGLFLVGALAVASIAMATWEQPRAQVLSSINAEEHCPLPRVAKAPVATRPDHDLLLFMFGLSQGLRSQN